MLMVELTVEVLDWLGTARSEEGLAASVKYEGDSCCADIESKLSTVLAPTPVPILVSAVVL